MRICSCRASISAWCCQKHNLLLLLLLSDRSPASSLWKLDDC
ncbi:unnamed protein product [Hymenolepis diminuta]|uniref:Uncharacterized protein n=1 Tax=Hymenolepis diminuta TaxID=6216 RepID=A0A0R3SV66_HYMDI|nr:unnamed protein product [Hymenolepis diminuta]